MRRTVSTALALTLPLGLLALMSCNRLASDATVAADARSGGETTVFTTSRDAFAKPLANLPTQQLRDFTFGNKMFNTNWVTAPASVTTLDGLGPTFNRVSCSGCHFKDGRGRPPRSGAEPMNSMLVRLSLPGKDANGAPIPHPAYGLQLNDKAIHGVRAEGQAKIDYTELPGAYADGTAYSLRAPAYRFEHLAFGPLGDDIQISPRVAPAVFGLGLLEAVPEAAIVAMADPQDADHDGIKGVPNYLWDAKENKKVLGRFGWKANAPSLLLQDASAANGDLGITTTPFARENCLPAQKACLRALTGGTPEMSDEQLRKLVFYSQTLAPPARRDVEDAMVKRGAALFERAQCGACHKPTLKTGAHPVAALSHQAIQPFTDLLLHDMGEGLADGRPDFEAGGSQWRTAPLWGIGLVDTVNQHTFFLHDGRARNLAEAILWHGGEAARAKERFRAMSADDRAALLAFLESL